MWYCSHRFLYIELSLYSWNKCHLMVEISFYFPENSLTLLLFSWSFSFFTTEIPSLFFTFLHIICIMIFLFLGIPAPVVLLSFNSLHSYPDCVLTSDCMILEFVKYQPLVTTSTHVLVFYYIPLVYMSVFAITILFVGRDCFGYLVFVLFHINFRTFFFPMKNIVEILFGIVLNL